MLVGHMPDMGAIASHLISGTDRSRIEFKKAAVARISFERHLAAGQGVLEWLLPPGILKRNTSARLSGELLSQEEFRPGR